MRMKMPFNNALLPAIMVFFHTTHIFLSAFFYGSGIYINILSRVDWKRELGMQLDYLIKLNF